MTSTIYAICNNKLVPKIVIPKSSTENNSLNYNKSDITNLKSENNIFSLVEYNNILSKNPPGYINANNIFLISRDKKGNIYFKENEDKTLTVIGEYTMSDSYQTKILLEQERSWNDRTNLYDWRNRSFNPITTNEINELNIPNINNSDINFCYKSKIIQDPGKKNKKIDDLKLIGYIYLLKIQNNWNVYVVDNVSNKSVNLYYNDTDQVTNSLPINGWKKKSNDDDIIIGLAPKPVDYKVSWEPIISIYGTEGYQQKTISENVSNSEVIKLNNVDGIKVGQLINANGIEDGSKVNQIDKTQKSITISEAVNLSKGETINFLGDLDGKYMFNSSSEIIDNKPKNRPDYAYFYYISQYLGPDIPRNWFFQLRSDKTWYIKKGDSSFEYIYSNSNKESISSTK